MPLVNIHMAEGRTPEQKRALMEAMTDAMVEHVGAARESVRVWILEFPVTDFMAGGELLADKRARLAAEATAAPRVGAPAAAPAAAPDGNGTL
jgi:4-oxalocrotonate tautomerase